MSILPPSALSAPPYSPGCAPDGGEEAQSQIVSKPRRKPKVLLYPSDVPRIIRLGPCAFGVNTGPVADDADLTKLAVPMLKEPWRIRCTLSSSLTTMKARQDLLSTSMTYRPRSNCKHIRQAADVLTHILRAPAELLPQRTLFTGKLMKLFDRAPKVRFTAAEASTDPPISDGVPKPKDGKCCPVYFKDIGETQTVCGGKCGNHTHSSRFDVYAQELSGWAVDCAVCQGTWSPAAV
ncbi:hypothetical protein LY76DRAFT_601124 [Colletotrichum caudatum]|nr:hypothetical protein LY76DRAFT_601124 [Colletotrichum caudatum]